MGAISWTEKQFGEYSEEQIDALVDGVAVAIDFEIDEDNEEEE